MILNAIISLNGSALDLNRVLTEPDLATEMAKLIVGRPGLSLCHSGKFIVDYNLSLSKMIEASNYHCYHGGIVKEFSPKGSGRHEVELVMVELDGRFTTSEILRYMHRKGLVPAKIEHLLVYNTPYTQSNNTHSIMALGSVCTSGHCPYIRIENGKRGLSLCYNSDNCEWPDNNIFLAVKK